jgi:hypothetical protein
MPESGERKQIQGLPQGWVWDYSAGTYEEQVGGRRTGNIRKGRHAVNYLSGDTLTVKAVRNIQRTGQGLPVTPTPKRTLREGLLYTKKAVHRYRGNTVSYSFRTIEDAETFILGGNIPRDYQALTIQTKFKRSRIPGKVYKRPGQRNLYATLSPFLARDLWDNPDEWERIYSKGAEFEYDANSRVYVYAVEY